MTAGFPAHCQLLKGQAKILQNITEHSHCIELKGVEVQVIEAEVWQSSIVRDTIKLEQLDQIGKLSVHKKLVFIGQIISQF